MMTGELITSNNKKIKDINHMTRLEILNVSYYYGIDNNGY